MSLKIILGLFIFSCFATSFSQPGGGGGLNISYIKFVNGDTLDFSDKNFKINHYVMNKKFSKIEYEFTADNKKYSNYYTGNKAWFYLPPDYYDNNFEYCKNQRLEIIYKIDTMTIDFYGIMGENGAGHTEQLDVIEFFPGNYKFHLTESERFDSCWQLRNQFPDQIDKLQEDMRKGITQITKPNLKSWHILEEEFNPNIEIFWARVNRESCTETGLHGPANFTRLCECMIELTATHFYLKTEQKPTKILDTSAYCFYFYHVFKEYPIEVRSYDEKKNNQIYPPVEEDRIAQNYLDALEKYTLYINGSRYTGKIVLNVNHQSMYPMFGVPNEQIIYNYKEGKLLYKYKMQSGVPSGPSFDVRE